MQKVDDLLNIYSLLANKPLFFAYEYWSKIDFSSNLHPK